jgi:hypothetical protein
MKRLVTWMLLAMIGGCATGPMGFSKQGATEAQVRQDADACGYDAKSKNMGNMLLGSELKPLIEQCMRGKGYTVKQI